MFNVSADDRGVSSYFSPLIYQVPELQCYKALVRITDFVKVLRDENAAMESSGAKLRLHLKALGGCSKHKRKAGGAKRNEASAELLLFPEVTAAPAPAGVDAAVAAGAVTSAHIARKAEAAA